MIDIDGLQVRLGRRPVLDDVDLHLPVGVHGLLGPNGAGKTTLIRVLATTLRHDAGTVNALGCSYADADGVRHVRENLGYLPQSFGYHRGFTAREYVEYVAWLRRVPRRQIPAAADHALARVDLAGQADVKLRRLSGGMLRRAGLAQALVNEPRLLLLDEPTVGLDPEQRVRFRELLRQIGLDACVLVSTHLVEDVAHACDTVTLLDAGKVVASTDPTGLSAAGADSSAAGDSAVERGYTAMLRSSRS